jgi:hypothetical protein
MAYMSRTVRLVSGVNEGISFDMVEGQELKIGRSAINDVVIPYDSCISGKHALIKMEAGRILVLDLASTNGTFIADRRLNHGVFEAVDEFFVIGSTILTLTDDSRPCEYQPLNVETARQRAWSACPLFHTALANFEKEPFLHVGHLFISLAALHGEALVSVFTKLGLKVDHDNLRKAFRSHKVFSGEDAWLNRFLALRARMPREPSMLITPKVQAILDGLDAEDRDNPEALLDAFLKDDFNLVFPRLDWRKNAGAWRNQFQQQQARPSAEPFDRIDTSFSEKDFGLHRLLTFWRRLEKAHTQKELLVLTGSTGCGKTTVLHYGFEKQDPPFLSESFYKGPRTFLDPKAFLFYNHPSKLSAYAFRAREMIQRGEFLVIDHFDNMLLAMQSENLDRAGLIKTLRSHTGPVILCVRKENMELIDTHLGTVNILDLDHHLEPMLKQFHERFLISFEKRVEGILSPKAKRFFHEKVAALEPYNFGSLKEFLILCAGRAEAINPTFSELGEETRESGLLGVTTFKDVYDQWMRAHGKAPSGGEKETEVLVQLERLLHEFTKQAYNVHLRYGDQTRGFEDPGRLSRNQKLDELKSHLVYLFSSFQGGFGQWFQEFWMRLDPDVIQAENPGANAKKLWSEFRERTKTMDNDYAEDLYSESLAKVFLECMRTRKTIN